MTRNMPFRLSVRLQSPQGSAAESENAQGDVEALICNACVDINLISVFTSNLHPRRPQEHAASSHP